MADLTAAEKAVSLDNLDTFKRKIEDEISGSGGLVGKIFTILASGWTEYANTIGGYSVRATITDNSVKQTDFVDLVFDINYADALEAAGVAFGGQTEDGKIYLYAKSGVKCDVSGMYYIYDVKNSV